MSSRLITLILFVLAGSALAQTETTTEAASEAVEQATQATAEAVETAVEATEQAVEEVTEAVVEETEAAVEEATEAVAEEAEAAVEEATEAVAEEAEAAVEEATEAVAEEAEAATEEATDTVTGETEEATDTAMAADGVATKVAACAACHGADGNSVIPQNPKLAGQVPGFIADQLAKFKSGERENAIMGAQVANLSEEDMKEIDAYYSSQQAQLGAISEEMQEMALVGEKIFRGGEPSMSISACMSCHGPSGHGIPTRFPKVSGQHVEYLEQQLLAYKSGSRVSAEMNPIAFRLSEQQIKSLAAYMHALK